MFYKNRIGFKNHESVPLHINLLAANFILKDVFIYTSLLLGISLGFFACDSTTSPIDIFQDKPAITNFSINPQNVQFTSSADGVKDTTVQVIFTIDAVNLGEYAPQLTVTDRFSGETALEQVLPATGNENEFSLQVPFETRTTFFEEYKINVLVQDDHGNYNYAEASLNLLGFSEVAPEILEANNPDSLQRPAEGEDDKPVAFLAKVNDEEGLDTIESVFMHLISRESGEVTGSPFQLYDNGEAGGDVTANDSVFTRVFRFSSDNKLQTYDILYYAVDKGALVSDTVRTTFSIVE